MKGQEKDIYLPSVITTKDRGKIQIFYDEQRRIMSIHSFASWNSLSDSTSITIYYDKKGRIRQKYQSVTKIDNDSMKPLLSTGSTYDYTYKKKGIIDVYVFKSTKFYGTDMYELDANHAQIYTDRDKNIVKEWFDSKKEKISLFKSKFNKDGTLSAYFNLPDLGRIYKYILFCCRIYRS